MKSSSLLRTWVQWIGLIAGPLFALTCYWMLPFEYRGGEGEVAVFSSAGRVTLSVMVWMAIWWLTEAIDISVTALLPLVLFPLLGATTMHEAAAPFGHPLIFLFMGGFLLALSMKRWKLDQRIALLTLRIVGTNPMNMIGGIMLVTAVLSAFVSNTATAAMMLPVALSLIRLVQSTEEPASETEMKQPSPFALCMLLGLAYSASIGGMATIIGSPPNAFLVGFVSQSIDAPFRNEIGFAQWMLFGVPLAVVFLPVIWWMLTRVIYPIRLLKVKGGKQLIQEQLALLGRVSRGEWSTFSVFSLTAICWIMRPLLSQIEWVSSGETVYPLGGLSDAGIAMTGAIILFILPVDFRKREFVMNWETAKELPWGILILFGGGLSLAAAVQSTGVAEYIGSQAQFLRGMPTWVLVLAVTSLIVFLTELTSNTATTATLVPVLAALAPALGVHPYLLIFPAALAASCAFMMPIATPPNAIVFGSNEITLPQMMKAGFVFNLFGIVLISLFTVFAMSAILGI